MALFSSKNTKTLSLSYSTALSMKRPSLIPAALCRSRISSSHCWHCYSNFYCSLAFFLPMLPRLYCNFLNSCSFYGNSRNDSLLKASLSLILFSISELKKSDSYPMTLMRKRSKDCL